MTKPSMFLSKTEILDAAEQSLRRFGPDKTSVTDVAKLLGVSHGTLYRHFPSKAILREAVTERWLEESILVPLTEIVNHIAENPLEQLKNYIMKLIELKHLYAEQDPEMFKMYADVTAESADLIDAHVRRIIEQMITLIAMGIETNLIHTTLQTEVLARSIFNATARFHHPAHAYQWLSTDIEQEFSGLWYLLEKGLTAPAK
ncbi:TetR family transcriptional regulator [Paenibacillus monticola]|uniref:TetR family transcriptional regulator n=1 Tax=Paenibacillus monticola TaxID=2666075 RepID=A0A7X2H631_9BACL|nr:TetR family transcriptional regulator [Paenibacillus monticola]MRN54212.1 TetR family transcriptional regulator [Paenibacillus monticola]